MQRATPDGFANPGGVTTDRMIEILDASNAEPDPEARNELLIAGSREMAESVLEIPLMYPIVPFAMRSEVSWTPFTSSILEFRDVSVAAD
jgi:ABC-type transport system substrate-binding protein